MLLPLKIHTFEAKSWKDNIQKYRFDFFYYFSSIVNTIKGTHIFFLFLFFLNRTFKVCECHVFVTLACLTGPGVEGHRNTTKMSYVCPPQFIRLGHSCYFFSDNNATWQSALFACKVT